MLLKKISLLFFFLLPFALSAQLDTLRLGWDGGNLPFPATNTKGSKWVALTERGVPGRPTTTSSGLCLNGTLEGCLVRRDLQGRTLDSTFYVQGKREGPFVIRDTLGHVQYRGINDADTLVTADNFDYWNTTVLTWRHITGRMSVSTSYDYTGKVMQIEIDSGLTHFTRASKQYDRMGRLISSTDKRGHRSYVPFAAQYGTGLAFIAPKNGWQERIGVFTAPDSAHPLVIDGAEVLAYYFTLNTMDQSAIVLEQKGRWLHVRKLDASGIFFGTLDYWVRPPDDWLVKFRSWEQIITQENLLVGVVFGELDSIRSAPRDDAPAVACQDLSSYLRVQEVQGDWLKVRIDPDWDETGMKTSAYWQQHPKTKKNTKEILDEICFPEAWVRWRNDNDLLIGTNFIAAFYHD